MNYNNKRRQIYPLHTALEEGRCFEQYINKLSINHRNNSFLQTPLHIAAYHGSIDFFQNRILCMLALDIDWPSQRDLHRCTPAHYAAQQGHVDVLQALIDLHQKRSFNWLQPKENLSILKRQDKWGFLPIHYAVAHGFRADNADRLKQLLLKQTQPNTQRISQTTPLHYALSYGQLDSIEHFFNALTEDERRIVINTLDAEHLSPYELASYLGYKSLAVRFHAYLNADESINTADDLRLALIAIVNEENDEQRLQSRLSDLLASHPNLINQQTLLLCEDQTKKVYGGLLHWACARMYGCLVIALLNQQANTNLPAQVIIQHTITQTKLTFKSMTPLSWLDVYSVISTKAADRLPTYNLSQNLIDSLHGEVEITSGDDRQFLIKKFMQAANYHPAGFYGYCFAFTELYTTAFLSQQLQQFNNRTYQLLQLALYVVYTQTSHLFMRNVSLFDQLKYRFVDLPNLIGDTDQAQHNKEKLLAIQAFCDNLSCLQVPLVHGALLPGTSMFNQNNNTYLKSLIQPVDLKYPTAISQGVLVDCYNKDSLQNTLSTIKDGILHNGCQQFALKLKIQAHMIGVYYDDNLASPWIYMDIEQCSEWYYQDSEEELKKLVDELFRLNKKIDQTNLVIASQLMLAPSCPSKTAETISDVWRDLIQRTVSQYDTHSESDQAHIFPAAFFSALGDKHKDIYLDWMKSLPKQILTEYQKKVDEPLLFTLLVIQPYRNIFEPLLKNPDLMNYKLDHEHSSLVLRILPDLGYDFLKFCVDNELIKINKNHDEEFYPLEFLLLGAAQHPSLDRNNIMSTARYFMFQGDQDQMFDGLLDEKKQFHINSHTVNLRHDWYKHYLAMTNQLNAQYALFCALNDNNSSPETIKAIITESQAHFDNIDDLVYCPHPETGQTPFDLASQNNAYSTALSEAYRECSNTQPSLACYSIVCQLSSKYNNNESENCWLLTII